MGRLLVVVLVGLVAVSCGGSSDPTTTTDDPGSVSTTTSPSLATTTTSGNAQAPADFPIPIMEGGMVESAYATEVTVLYPEGAYDQLLEFYEDYSSANAGTAYELFVGREWEVGGALINVTPVDQTTHPNRPAGAVLFIRLP